jgi:hypothetical protein
MISLSTQNTHTRRVKRADPHLLGNWPNKCLHAIAHFLSGFVGERNSQNMHGVRAMSNEIRDALRKHSGFARTGTSNNE